VLDAAFACPDLFIDLTPIGLGSGSSRWLDMVEGSSTAGLMTWLAEQDQAWRDAVEVVAMDGFTGFKTSVTQLPDEVAAINPFHVVRWASDALDACRRRVQQDCAGIEGAQVPRWTGRDGPSAPVTTSSPTSRPHACRPIRRRGTCLGAQSPGRPPEDRRGYGGGRGRGAAAATAAIGSNISIPEPEAPSARVANWDRFARSVN
jgi:hypothetical protein